MPVYIPRKQNVIQRILKDHFSDFEEQYDDHYAKQYGKCRIIRIKEAVEKFLSYIKHKSMILTLYSTGIRASRIIHLKVTDIDSSRMQIRIDHDKGG